MLSFDDQRTKKKRDRHLVHQAERREQAAVHEGCNQPHTRVEVSCHVLSQARARGAPGEAVAGEEPATALCRRRRTHARQTSSKQQTHGCWLEINYTLIGRCVLRPGVFSNQCLDCCSKFLKGVWDAGNTYVQDWHPEPMVSNPPPACQCLAISMGQQPDANTLRSPRHY